MTGGGSAQVSFGAGDGGHKAGAYNRANARNYRCGYSSSSKPSVCHAGVAPSASALCDDGHPRLVRPARAVSRGPADSHARDVW